MDSWNLIKQPNNNKIFLTTGGGLILANSLIKKSKYSDYGIYSCPIWGSINKKFQQNQIDKFDQIITVEDHLIDGGFGSWLRESIQNPESHLKIINKAYSNNIIGKVGSEDYLSKMGGF